MTSETPPNKLDSSSGGTGAEKEPGELDREHFIPIGRDEVFDSLPQIDSIPTEQQHQLRELFRVIDAYLHQQYHVQYSDINRLYAPLDPDSVNVSQDHSAEICDANTRHVFDRLQQILERANYRRLDKGVLEDAIETAGVLGIRLSVDFSLFEELHVYAQGDRTEVWRKRTWWKFFREEEFDVAVYQRLIIAFRLKDHRKLPKDQSTDVVYIKSFKSIPHSDMHALLPGTRVRMSLLDQGKIILPTLSGLAVNLFKMFRMLMVVSVFATIFSLFQVTGLIIGVIAYIAKGIFTYIQTKDKYLLNLTRHLYFQNLDNNSGVLLRVLSEAEEQDYREVVIAYYILWKFGENGLLENEIDEIAELNLIRATRLDIDFEVDDALQKLSGMHLAIQKNDRWFCVPISNALAELDFRWDSVFAYHWPSGVEKSDSDRSS